MEKKQEQLEKLLADDETVLWQSRPESFGLLAGTYRNSFLRRIAVCVAAMAVVLILYSFAVSGRGIAYSPVVVVLVLAVGLFLIFRQILDDSRIRKTALYAVTDRRLIVLVGKDVRIAALDEVPSWAIRRDEDGYASALFGETAVNCIPGKWRELALCGTYKEEDTGVCKALVFYAVPDPDALERVLREVLPGKSA